MAMTEEKYLILKDICKEVGCDLPPKHKCQEVLANTPHWVRVYHRMFEG